MSANYGHLTPTQTRMLALLADGERHPSAELQACLYDELGRRSNIGYHIHFLRKKLRGAGELIVCEVANRRAYYRHVRLLCPVPLAREASVVGTLLPPPAPTANGNGHPA